MQSEPEAAEHALKRLSAPVKTIGHNIADAFRDIFSMIGKALSRKLEDKAEEIEHTKPQATLPPTPPAKPGEPQHPAGLPAVPLSEDVETMAELHDRAKKQMEEIIEKEQKN